MQLPDVDPNAYPVDRWAEQRRKYADYWYHFDGRFLDEKDELGQLKYPLGLNPFALACYIHAAFLFGEVPDSTAPLVNTVVEPKSTDRRVAEMATEFVAAVWEDNDGQAKQMEAGIISQVLGGVVFGVFYDPDLPSGIRIDMVLPEYFFPAWAHNQYWRLPECFIAYEVNAIQAKAMGVTPKTPIALYQEHWTPEQYEITIDGQAITWAGIRQEGRTIGGMVPYVYIPHIRVGDFYGISLLEGKDLLAREINDRYADVGDIVAENARMLPAVWGTNRPTVRHLAGGFSLLDLGMPAPGRPEPGIAFPSGSIQVNEPTARWSQDLLVLGWISAFVPPVVFGLDEGSQRSALTLSLRMVPLISHIRKERAYWNTGLTQIARLILTIGAEKGLIDIDAGQIRRLRFWHEWGPILPRDAQQLINDLILLSRANLISPKNAIQRLRMTHDVDAEMEQIREWMEYEASLRQPPQNEGMGAGSMGELAGYDFPQEPQPKTTGGE